jgi:hypothetical protein
VERITVFNIDPLFWVRTAGRGDVAHGLPTNPHAVKTTYAATAEREKRGGFPFIFLELFVP